MDGLCEKKQYQQRYHRGKFRGHRFEEEKIFFQMKDNFRIVENSLKNTAL